LAPFALIPIVQTCDAPPQNLTMQTVATCEKRTRWVSVAAQEATWNNDFQVDDTTLKRGIYHAMLFRNQLAYQAQYDFKLHQCVGERTHRLGHKHSGCGW
jgi:hypothetical protein